MHFEADLEMNKNTLIILTLCASIMISPVIAQTTNTVVAKYGSSPIIDGTVDDSEWSDASTITFNGVQVFVKQDGVHLNVAFKSPVLEDSGMFIYIDVNNDNSTTLSSDDICIDALANGTRSEFHKASGAAVWELASASGWTGAFLRTATACQAEFSIDYSKLGLVAGTEKTMGINFEYVSFLTLEDYFWSFNSAYVTNRAPFTWGSINSSGYNWIPEFPSLAIVSLIMMAMPFVAIAYRRSHAKSPKAVLSSRPQSL